MTTPKPDLAGRQDSVQVHPFPVKTWSVSTPATLPVGHRLLVAMTPFGPHTYILNRDDAMSLSKALAAPGVALPTI